MDLSLPAIDKILQRMVGELHEQMIKMKPKWQDSLKHVNTNETDAMKLLAQWSSLIQQLSEEAVKTVIVIDGLNSIEEQSKVYKVGWLPLQMTHNGLMGGEKISRDTCHFIFLDPPLAAREGVP